MQEERHRRQKKKLKEVRLDCIFANVRALERYLNTGVFWKFPDTVEHIIRETIKLIEKAGEK